MGATGRRKNCASSVQTYGSAARCVTLAALKEIRHWLPLAAVRTGTDDGESVHRLRVATRRASVALNAFADLTDPQELSALKIELRQIRKAAEAARNIDAMTERFLSGVTAANDDHCTKLRARLAALRDDAQAPIVVIDQRLVETGFDERALKLLADMPSRHARRAANSFKKQARKILKPALKHFFDAAKGDLFDDTDMHCLRIQGKKLRYTMEIVGKAFKPTFSDALYRQLCDFQDVLGAIRDRVFMQDQLRSWTEKSIDESERAFLKGLLKNEKNMQKKSMQKFHSMWTEKCVRKLKQEFRAHMKHEE